MEILGAVVLLVTWTEAVALHAPLVTVTLYVLAEVTVMFCVVAPVLQR